MTDSQATVTREVEEHQVRLLVQAKRSQKESLVQIGRTRRKWPPILSDSITELWVPHQRDEVVTDLGIIAILGNMVNQQKPESRTMTGKTRAEESRAPCRGRPIIFVTHSLGDTLVKDMVLQSLKYELQPHLQDVGKPCFAIFYFGTPSGRWCCRDIEQTSFISESHMNMCRFNCVSAPGYSDFKAALTDYLRIIEARRQSKSDRTQHEEEQREAVKQKGS